MTIGLKYKVGDTVTILDNSSGHRYDIGSLLDIISINKSDSLYCGPVDDDGIDWSFDDEDCALAWNGSAEDKTTDTTQVKPHGGATAYYDMPFADWCTSNDMIEYLAEHKWGRYGVHLKDIFKGLCRWGDKEGTTVEYDTRKTIYYGCRVLKMIVGTTKMRQYLQELLDDKQFKGE